MIIYGIYLVLDVLVPFVVANLLQVVASTGVLIVVIIGILMAMSSLTRRNLTRGFASGIISGIWQGIVFCWNLLIGAIAGILQWTSMIAPLVYRRSRGFFINRCGMSQGCASVCAFLVAGGMVIVII